MADEAAPAPADIQAYGDYLKTQGAKPQDIQAYTDYLAAHQNTDSGGSNWMDASFAPEGSPLHFSARGVAQGALQALPRIGQVVGGIGGMFAGGPAGAVTGAAGGQAAGESLRSGIASATGLDAAPKSSDEFYRNIADAAVTGAESEMTGQILPAAAKSFGASGLQTITGTNAKDISTYAAKAAQITDMAKAANGDVAVAANTMRKQFTKDIDEARSAMSNSISEALSGNNSRVNGAPIIDALEEYKGKIDADLYKGERDQVDGLIADVRKKFDENGQIFVGEAHTLKKYLQDKASEAYRDPGKAQIGTQAAQAAKAGAAVTRGLVNEAVPQVAAANNVLAGFHELEDTLNKNLTEAGNNYATLVAAGRGDSAAGLTNATNLRALSELTGTDIIGEAEKLSAMDTFMGPKSAKPGRGSVPGALMGFGLGGAFGGPVGASGGSSAGYYLGGAVTSPRAIRGGLNATMPAANFIGQSGPAQSVLGQSVIRGAQGVKAIMQNEPGK